MTRPASHRMPSRGSRFATIARLDARITELNERLRIHGRPPVEPLNTIGHALQRAAIEGA